MCAAIADRLAGAAIENNGDDVVERIAFLANERRISKRDEKGEQGKRTQPRSRATRDDGERHRNQADNAEGDDQRNRYLRREREIESVHVS